MQHSHDHKDILAGLASEYEELLETSEQAVYVYLDDHNKLCNKKFSALLGYKSEKDWQDIKGAFTELFVDKSSQSNLVSAYKKVMENLSASQIDVTWKKKDGKTVKTKVILVPIVYSSHVFALHFISQA